MTGLTASDPHHWGPITQVVDYVASLIPEGARVLEIGPGHAPFRRATHFVDNVPRGDLPITMCDCASEPLPFPDKSFDFIYCRHVLEDMFNPFPLVKEMSRVGKAGYIETPSPIAELCRGVDGGAPYYRGYHHHRFIVWMRDDVLHFVSKYPIVEYFDVPDELLAQRLRSGSDEWNTYGLWRDHIEFKHMQNGLEFEMVDGYANLLADACTQSIAATAKFGELISYDELRQFSRSVA